MVSERNRGDLLLRHDKDNEDLVDELQLRDRQHPGTPKPAVTHTPTPRGGCDGY